MQIKVTMKYHFRPTNWQKLKRAVTPPAGRDEGKGNFQEWLVDD